MLKDEGLLVFSYHHSREDGWTSVAAAVLNAGFKLVQTQPVKAELCAGRAPQDLLREFELGLAACAVILQHLFDSQEGRKEQHS